MSLSVRTLEVNPQNCQPFNLNGIFIRRKSSFKICVLECWKQDTHRIFKEMYFTKVFTMLLPSPFDFQEYVQHLIEIKFNTFNPLGSLSAHALKFIYIGYSLFKKSFGQTNILIEIKLKA
eukprot:TRINITY_DN2567_c0_g1_i5.p5 TRINITY_DN2567_c0_g1~~TRINITY_DN2567_c0_g1_i5.p5  ORF type:complete len:120 (-),score=0.84 TRINITY_DN2567_c0_g1_i5:650-1009(-)